MPGCTRTRDSRVRSETGCGTSGWARTCTSAKAWQAISEPGGSLCGRLLGGCDVCVAPHEVPLCAPRYSMAVVKSAYDLTFGFTAYFCRRSAKTGHVDIPVVLRLSCPGSGSKFSRCLLRYCSNRK